MQDRAIIHTSSAAAELQRGCCLRQSGCMLPLAPGTLRAGIIPSLGSNAKNNQLGTTQPAGYNTTQPSTAQAPELPDLRFSGTCDDFPPFQLGRQTPTSFPHAGDGSIALLLHQAAQHRLPPRMQLPLHHSTKSLPFWRSSIPIGLGWLLIAQSSHTLAMSLLRVISKSLLQGAVNTLLLFSSIFLFLHISGVSFSTLLVGSLHIPPDQPLHFEHCP